MVRRVPVLSDPSCPMPTCDSVTSLCKALGRTCHRAGALLAAALMIAAVLSSPAQARSSGGYSRPSLSISPGSRSFGAPFGGGTGGYRRPPLSGAGPRPSFGLPSAGDRAVSRRSAGEALEQFRSQQRPATPRFDLPSRPSLGGPRDDGFAGYGGRPSFGPTYRPPTGYDWGWRPPVYVQPTTDTYHGWNPFLFWFLLDRLGRSGSTDFFHHHEYDPGYAQWRADADRQARDNAELRAKLDSLDAALAAKEDDPRDSRYLPAGVSAESAHATADVAEPTSSGGGSSLFLVVVLLVGAVAFLFYVSARHAASAARAGSGSGGARGGPMGGLKTAGNILRQKITDARAAPLKPFRVGMALTLDPTPFVLAQGKIKVPAPKARGSTLFASVKAVGRIEGAPLFRLHLDDDTFVQIHLDGDRPDECRYFAQIDEVTPADADDWKAWLEPGEGMIGWPQFQTKDQKLYDRVWSPGAQWVEPVPYVETLDGTTRAGPVKGAMMLYGAATGLADPAPPTEYILVASVESASAGAWVAVYAGIDVNPAGLSLT